jgi:hypothetical protein
MKTNRSAGWIVRIRVLLVCLALVAIAGIEFGVSQSLADRIGQVSAHQTDGPQLPSVSLSDVLVAAR